MWSHFCRFYRMDLEHSKQHYQLITHVLVDPCLCLTMENHLFIYSSTAIYRVFWYVQCKSACIFSGTELYMNINIYAVIK